MFSLAMLKNDWSKSANLFSIGLIAAVFLSSLLILVDPASVSVRRVVVLVFVATVIIDYVKNHTGKKFVRDSHLEHYLTPIVGNLLSIPVLIIICIVHPSIMIFIISTLVIVLELLICKNKISAVNCGEEVCEFVSDFIKRVLLTIMISLFLFTYKGIWLEETLCLMPLSVLFVAWSYYDYRKRYNRKFRRQCAM